MNNKSASLIALFLLLLAATSASAFYDPGTQKWLNRDPIAEPGFELLSSPQVTLQEAPPHAYRFVENNPVSKADPLGLQRFGFCTCIVVWGPGAGCQEECVCWDVKLPPSLPYRRTFPMPLPQCILEHCIFNRGLPYTRPNL